MPPVPKPKKQPKKQKSRDFAHLDKVAALPCAAYGKDVDFIAWTLEQVD